MRRSPSPYLRTHLTVENLEDRLLLTCVGNPLPGQFCVDPVIDTNSFISAANGLVQEADTFADSWQTWADQEQQTLVAEANTVSQNPSAYAELFAEAWQTWAEGFTQELTTAVENAPQNLTDFATADTTFIQTESQQIPQEIIAFFTSLPSAVLADVETLQTQFTSVVTAATDAVTTTITYVTTETSVLTQILVTGTQEIITASDTWVQFMAETLIEIIPMAMPIVDHPVDGADVDIREGCSGEIIGQIYSNYPNVACTDNTRVPGPYFQPPSWFSTFVDQTIDYLDAADEGAVDGLAMVINAGTFHRWDDLNDYVDQAIEENGGLYTTANVTAHVGAASTYAAVALTVGPPLYDQASQFVSQLLVAANTPSAVASGLTAAASTQYPKLVALGNQWHHLWPKFLGLPPEGIESIMPKLVLLPAPYHQLITNAFNQLPGGLTPQQLFIEMQRIYAQLAISGFPVRPWP